PIVELALLRNCPPAFSATRSNAASADVTRRTKVRWSIPPSAVPRRARDFARFLACGPVSPAAVSARAGGPGAGADGLPGPVAGGPGLAGVPGATEGGPGLGWPGLGTVGGLLTSSAAPGPRSTAPVAVSVIRV